MLYQLRRLVFDQSSPVHPVSESRGGTLSVTEKDKGRRTEEILVSNFGFYRGQDFKDYNGIYNSKHLQKPKFLILCTKTHSYELIFHPHIEEDQTKPVCFVKKIDLLKNFF